MGRLEAGEPRNGPERVGLEGGRKHESRHHQQSRGNGDWIFLSRPPFPHFQRPRDKRCRWQKSSESKRVWRGGGGRGTQSQACNCQRAR